MPIYTYRREDGTTFDQRQKFSDDPLEICPTTGQRVARIVQAPAVIFKGSGFYVNDSKKANNGNLNSGKTNGSETKSEPETKTETKAETKTETTEKTSSPKTESAAD